MPRLLVVSTLMLLTVSIAGAPPALALDCSSGDSTCQQLQQAKQNQQAAQSRLEQVKQSLADAQAKAQQTMAIINDLNNRIAVQKRAIAATQAKIDETERQIRFTQAEIARREAHMQVRQSLLDQRVRAMAKHGTVNYFELVVSSKSFNQLVDRVVVMQDIVRSDQLLLQTLKGERDQLVALRQKLDVQRSEEASLLRQQQDQQAQLQVTLRDQQTALAYYATLEAQFQQQRAELEAEKARFDDLVVQLQAQYDNQARGYGGGSGQFAWPERGPITQGFGCTDFLLEPYDPNCATRHFHTGLDIGASGGTTIHAADAGVVSFAGWGGGYGNVVIVTHGNGYSTLYGHMAAFAAGTGDRVNRGQPIGYEGSTGFSTGPHLHFEIRLNGAYQNPLSYLT
ncbi:peptidoglycan DD-metalloendopeptidase family protein [Candidatus Nephthysia bennettiae]|uniref:murein hydrolase activator EnvC family protein n=1 Tax=Candidatus Nephthysia bennettiae TaxID=3127016 RepID=UPI0030C6D824